VRRLFAIATSFTAAKRKAQEDLTVQIEQEHEAKKGLIVSLKRKLASLFEASRQECLSTLAGPSVPAF
jgi:hypothetical protein